MKIYLILRNPILNSVHQFQGKSNIANSSIETTQSSSRNNLLTRSIVCKAKGEQLTKGKLSIIKTLNANSTCFNIR